MTHSPNISGHLTLHRRGGGVFVLGGLHTPLWLLSFSFFIQTASEPLCKDQMLVAVTRPAESSQPLHHLTVTTDPVQSCTLWIKLAKTWQNKAHSSCCHLQSPAVSLSRCPSCIWADREVANTCPAQTETGVYTHTHKLTHTSPHHPGWMRDSRLGRHGTASDQWRGTLGASS